MSGPTEEFPDPLPADSVIPTPKSARKPPTKRRKLDLENEGELDKDKEDLSVQSTSSQSNDNGDTATEEESTVNSTASQTSSKWMDQLLDCLARENEKLKKDLAEASLHSVQIKRQLAESEDQCQNLERKTTVTFTVEEIIKDEKLIQYYTGFSKESFLAIFKFLVPEESQCPLDFVGKGNLSQIKMLSLKNQLFLTLCKLRNDFDSQDLAHRFAITPQVTSVVFSSWVNYMFLRFGEVSIWPHRDILTENMPEDYKKEFPNTFPIVDCNELKIQKPSSLKAQSQTYSDYKSTNTLKALVAVDPRGSVIFSSMLFAGAMSDKEIFLKSGFQSTLKSLVETGYLKEGDGVMADKGFDIEKEVEETGLKLNIPPFARSGMQMNQHDVMLTQKIAKHRVHVERAIRRIKSFKIISGRISVSLLSSIDQIWYVCSFLTNFMPPCIKKK